MLVSLRRRGCTDRRHGTVRRAAALQCREPAELGAQFVGCGVGQAVHLVRSRGARLDRSPASQPQLA